jgi:hypothetical protein
MLARVLPNNSLRPTCHLSLRSSRVAADPRQAAALGDCAAFVNWRQCEQGGAPVLALSYHQ